jgi:membrane-bound metal-dependent hydrolase YbcI (DUF457 family)
MPTPVGHALGGIAVYVAARGSSRPKDWPLAIAVVVSALLPDLDFAIGPFAGRSYHHYFTHSLGFTVLFAGVSYLGARFTKRAAPFRDAAVLTAAYFSHIFLDFLAKDATPPFGVQLLWPFSDTFYISPVKAFTATWRGSLAKLFGLHNWMAVGLEILVLLPIIALISRWRKRSPAQPE